MTRACTQRCWPRSGQQPCTSRACSTRRLVRGVNEVVKQIRRTLPTPPPASRPTLLGSLRRTPPAADEHDADSARYRWRLARRTLGIAQAHALHQHIASARAIGRQLGVNHGTVRQWLKLTPPDQATIAELSATATVLPRVEPPPLPWRDWDQVRRVREHLWLYRTLFLHKAGNLTTEERHKLAELLACPVGRDLRVAHTFLEARFAMWQDDLGQRRTPDEVEQRYALGRQTRTWAR